MAVRGSWAILPTQIDQVLELVSVALDHCRYFYSLVVDKATPKSDPASLQLYGGNLVTC